MLQKSMTSKDFNWNFHSMLAFVILQKLNCHQFCVVIVLDDSSCKRNKRYIKRAFAAEDLLKLFHEK